MSRVASILDESGLGIQIALASFVLKLQAKYGIVVLAFVGEVHATARWCLPHALNRI